jgi:hypothetical protein
LIWKWNYPFAVSLFDALPTGFHYLHKELLFQDDHAKDMVPSHCEKRSEGQGEQYDQRPIPYLLPGDSLCKEETVRCPFPLAPENLLATKNNPIGRMMELLEITEFLGVGDEVAQQGGGEVKIPIPA